jgi:hypothetical protein
MQGQTSSVPRPPVDEAGRRRRVRRSTLLLALVAVAFYVGFILMMLMRALR